ncbi:Opacity protein [Flaviramulus basaltis]|uniref:Opacity protein n=1 Tax=Flaviramulus basaltis TaxID=369401 RepID=A0A1K2IB10_9FLAO|nr:porin family protein [Flaviramulus basaltis]SFZ89597.1 Opacity protein [Flaviramulus basaltis]
MKNLFSAFICLITISTVSAQSWSDNFQIGAKGGINFATVTGDDFDSPDARTSFYAGLLAEIPVSERFSIQPEVFYSGQGFDITDEPDEFDAEYQVDYINVPLILKFYILDGFNIHAGPQFGFKINEELDFDPNNDGGDTDTDQIKDFDLGLSAGLGYKIGENFFVEARYTYGFSEVIEDTDVHNSVFSAGIGFMF